MPGYPPAALTAAAERIVERNLAEHPTAEADAYRRFMMPRALADAADALDGAAPFLGEHVARAILAHMEAHGPKSPSGEFLAVSRWRRHFSIAAQVAGRAFLTGEDERRIVAGAAAAGDYVACPNLEEEHDGPVN